MSLVPSYGISTTYAALHVAVSCALPIVSIDVRSAFRIFSTIRRRTLSKTTIMRRKTNPSLFLIPFLPEGAQ